MSFFAPPISPLHPTEGISQGVISGISRRQSSGTTSIHILDDDSLLNMFYLYRLAVTVTDEDENFDDVRTSIISGRSWDQGHWWYKPAHVCRKWRNLILGSPSFLGLYLVCTFGTPVADMLAHSPPLPLVIDYLDTVDRGRNMTAEDEDGIFLALEQPNRIRRIRVGFSFHNLENVVIAIDDELPILECLVLATKVDVVLFKTIQAPHLRNLVLSHVAPLIGSQLLTTSAGLVTFCLDMGDRSAYVNPNTLLQSISSLPQLETLVIIVTYPKFDVEKRLSDMPTITHTTLPNLRLLRFEGFSPYLEVLIRQIATPRLERLHIMLFDLFASSIPCLVQFMNTTENKRLCFDSAKLEISDDQVRVETYPHEENRRYSFSIRVESSRLNAHISSMARIVDALGQVFSAVDHLILDGSRSYEYDFNFSLVVDRTEWYQFLRPFSNVKNLHVNHGLVQEFSYYLQLNDGELPPELLPELQELTCPWSSYASDVFTSFIDARQNAGHPVSLVCRSPNPSP